MGATIRTDQIANTGYPITEIEPQETATVPRGTDGDEAAPKARGFLLDAPEREVAEWIAREVERREKAMTRRMEFAKANRARRKGMRFVRMRFFQDEAKAYIAPSTGKEPPDPNKCDQLVRRMVATLMVDPPKAEAVPASGEEKDRDAAEFSGRALEHELEKMGYDAKHEDALDRSFTWASSFKYFCVDPYGSEQAVEVLAHTAAVSVDPDPRMNPETGGIEGPFVKRFVREDGTLTQEVTEAKKQWVPRIRMEVLNAPHVHFIPEYCSGLEDADGVICCYPTTLGDLRSKFEDPAKPWPTEVLKELATFHPPKFEDLLPKFMDRSSVTDTSRWKNGVPPDEQVCFPYLTFMLAGATYKEGAYVLSIGKSRVLHRDVWVVDKKRQDQTVKREPLPIPLSQVRNLDDHQDGDPYGTTITQKLGNLDEIRALLIGGGLEYVDRFNHPREYLPIGSIVQPDDLNDRDGRPIMFNPEGKPEFENIPPLPDIVFKMLQFISQEMDIEASMVGAGGQTSGNITSGYQQRQVIEQSLVGMSGIKRNADRSFVMDCRIILALMGFFDIPQRLGYVSESGKYKEDEWTAADLGDTKDVKLRRGTSTMMAASAKQALARDELEVGMKAQDPMAYPNYRRAMAGNTDALIGAQDDPVRLRVRTQIHEWDNGPDEQLQGAQPPEPQPALDPMGQPIVDQMTGQPMMQPVVHPESEASRKLFQPALTIDLEPLNARIRHEELTAAIAGARFSRHSAEWQVGLLEEYERMRQAAGVMTLAEQAMAQQQAQQQQLQAEAQKSQTQHAQKREMQQAEHEAERGQREQDAATDMQRRQLELASRAA